MRELDEMRNDGAEAESEQTQRELKGYLLMLLRSDRRRLERQHISLERRFGAETDKTKLKNYERLNELASDWLKETLR